MNQTYFFSFHKLKRVLKVTFLTLILLNSGVTIGYSNSSIKESPAQDAEKKSMQSSDERKTVRGTVIDEDGNPLPGVQVSVKETPRGVSTDINGYYILNIEPGETISFSFLGFKPYEEVIKTGQLSLNITMKEDIQELDEVVVVGMGTQRKASVIGSIATVNLQDLRMSQPSLTANLSGRIAGTIAVQRSGEPGIDATDFWIRGISTFGTNQKPLTLIDGVERDINDLSIDEIESISILKDASATAVYGVRAANGVVVITTRKGVAQKPAVELKLEYGASDLPKVPKYLGSADYARLANEASGSTLYSERAIQLMENPTEWYHPYLYPNTNWFDEVFKKWSNTFTAAINISGGSERARYYIAASYLDNTGNMRNLKGNQWDSNPQQKRYNFRSNIDVNVTPTTILNVEIGANLTDLYQPGEGNRVDENDKQYWTPAERIFTYANLANPMFPAYFPTTDPNTGASKWHWGSPPTIGVHNPAERLFNSGYAKQYRVYAMTQIVLTQKLDFFLKGLSAKGTFAFDYYNNAMQYYRRNAQTSSIDNYLPAEDRFTYSTRFKGQDNLHYQREVDSNRAVEAKLQLIYDNLFNDVHRIGAMFMYHQREKVDAVKTNLGGGASTAIIQSLPYRKQGIAARATYSYDDRYFAEFNIGYNGSENFPNDDRFGVFPAGALGYIISNESFWKLDFVNMLKFRGSIGLVGNESLAIRNDLPLRFGFMDIYGDGLGSYNWGKGDGATTSGLGVSQVGVSNLTWEKGLKKNLGIELHMFNSKVTLDVDLFHEKRKDILIRRQTIPGFAGFGSVVVNANLGEMQNKGFELQASATEKVQDVTMKFWGNFTLAKNKVLKKDEPLREYAYRMEQGHRHGQQFGLIALGLFRDQDEIDNHTPQSLGSTPQPGDVKYLDYNGDGIVDEDDKVPIGFSNIPEISYGFGAQFMWKNFDLGIFFRGQDRVSYRLSGSGYIPFRTGVGTGNLYDKALDRWTPENPDQNAFYPRLTETSVNNNWAHNSTRNIYNGRFLRLDNLEVGYTFSRKTLAAIGINNLRVYFSGNNLALFSKWKMWDPETGSNNGAQYPISRQLNFGVKVNF